MLKYKNYQNKLIKLVKVIYLIAYVPIKGNRRKTLKISLYFVIGHFRSVPSLISNIDYTIRQ
jgi:hypothetical protein